MTDFMLCAEKSSPNDLFGRSFGEKIRGKSQPCVHDVFLHLCCVIAQQFAGFFSN